MEATEVDLGFEVPGRIARIDRAEGDDVASGAELATLDAAELRAARAAASAQAEAARARLLELERGPRSQEVGQADAAMRGTREREQEARREAERAERLFAGGAISRSARDRAATALEVAIATYEQADQAAALVRAGPRAETLAAQRVLLLDEPTFGVDPLSRRELWLILHEMVADGLTVVVSTSYLDEAERCDRVALLDRGRALALDRPEALQLSLDGRLRAMRSAQPRAAQAALASLTGVRSAVRFGNELHVLTDPEFLDATLLEALATAGVADAEVRDQAASLEDVFIQRVAETETTHG